MAFSPADILPRAFPDLTFEDIVGIVDRAEAEGETIWLEFKVELAKDAIAKSCAAFANTLGGLLIIGVDDGTRAIVGVKQPNTGPQTWVKDVLRERVLPMPPFRCRWFADPQSADQGLLVVLVGYSTTTPHILLKSGGIYLRSPGSSDPIRPIESLTTLWELVTRGRDARAEAIRAVSWARNQTPTLSQAAPDRWAVLATETAWMAPTGVPDGFDEVVFEDSGAAVRDALGAFAENDGGRIEDHDWKQDSFEVRWTPSPGQFSGYETVDSLRVDSRGTATFRSVELRVSSRSREAPPPWFLDHAMSRLQRAVDAGRELLLGCGCSGELRLAFHITHSVSRQVYVSDNDYVTVALNTTPIELWVDLVAGDRDNVMHQRIRHPIIRAVGRGSH